MTKPMSPEFSQPAPLPRREENQPLLEMLAEPGHDPRQALIDIQAALDVDIGSRPGIDLEPWIVTHDPDVVRSRTLSSKQYEAIRSFEEVLKVLGMHSTLTFGQMGLWWMDVKPALDYRTPLDTLFMSFTEEKGFDKEALQKVVHEATPFLSSTNASEDEAFWALIRD